MFVIDFFIEICQWLIVSAYTYFWEVVYLVFRNRPKKEIKNSQILITGTGSGLGRLLVQSLAKDGNTIHCVDIDVSGNEETKRLCQSHNCQIYTYHCNVGNLDCILKLKKEVQSQLPDSEHIEYLFNNAGIVIGKLFPETSIEEFHRVMNVNTLGVMNITKMFLDDMIKSGGHLVYICSVAGLTSAPFMTDYTASKHAITGFSRNLLLDLEYMGINNVKVTTVFPHFINTGMFHGSSIKLPLLFPILEPDWVTRQIITATREERCEVVLPRSISAVLVLMFVMNCSVFRGMCRLLGNDLMKSFKQTRKHEPIS